MSSSLNQANHTDNIVSRYHATKEKALNNPSQFWEEAASELKWHQLWHTVKDTSFNKDDVHIKWFDGGTLNIAENCLDRHLTDKANQPAIIWEPDSPDEQNLTLTYAQLHAEVMRCSNMLKALNVKAGDRVTIYMPMVPEAAIAMLACARIGAIHSVVFGGFSPASLRNRIEDCESRIVITADFSRRGGKNIPLKANVDEALTQTNMVDKVLVLNHAGDEIAWNESRDVWWHELAETVATKCPAEAFDAEHPLFVLYTSGSTGKPKGLAHSSAGYLLYAMHTFRNTFDYREGETYWCSADVGWITGHSYIVYGPLAAGATTLMFEGIPTYPDASRFWQIVDKYDVSIFYTAPTAIRMLMREGDEHVRKTHRTSLRVLGSVGEPINPEAWHWYDEVVGNKQCQIVDTWWQTETGGHMITPIPHTIETPAGSATLPYYGIAPVLCDTDGQELSGEATGALCIRDSWPGQARTIWGDHQRFVETYFSAFPGYYFSGDAARRDEQGNYWIEGRMDDVINMAGHRLGTAEVEAALNEHVAVVESAVVGIPDEVKGQAIYAFVILHPGHSLNDIMRKELNHLVRQEVGAIAIVKTIQETSGLPKTRSGKIMRRILRKIAAGEITSKADYTKLGDTSTLLNPEIIEELVQQHIS
jgi:acetyl-CoA synthetase